MSSREICGLTEIRSLTRRKSVMRRLRGVCCDEGGLTSIRREGKVGRPPRAQSVRSMLRFIGRRLLVAIPTLFLVITLAFFMMRAAPGGPFDTDRKLPPEIERNVMAKYGMNKPLGQQYL